MAKVKKAFDKESMYKKIMPTNFKKNNELGVESIRVDSNNEEIFKEERLVSINANTIYLNDKPISIEKGTKDEKDVSTYRNKETIFIKEEKNNVILYNVMEKLVLEKLDITLKKMNCCRCDRCKEDIVALALNNLKPMYIVASKDEIESKINELDKGLEVTSAVLKAVLSVRKNPRH